MRQYKVGKINYYKDVLQPYAVRNMIKHARFTNEHRLETSSAECSWLTLPILTKPVVLHVIKGKVILLRYFLFVSFIHAGPSELDKWKTPQVFTTTYEARSNGVCERSHTTVNLMLAKCINKNQKDWTEHLSHKAFCYNAFTHKSTKFSLFLLHGTEPWGNIDLQLWVTHCEFYSVDRLKERITERNHRKKELMRNRELTRNWKSVIMFNLGLL